ncbi:MAG: metal-binding protein [Zoogloea sp.]|nr:metal-binding protein [Zoogloea sp.]
MIDPQAFARNGDQFEGSVQVSALARLADLLVERSGELKFRIRGERDAEKRLFLVLHLEGVLKLECQRCLKPFDWSFDIDGRLLLVPPGQSMPDDDLEDDSCDPIEAAARMDVTSLLEDELLLAIPIVPRHEACETPVATRDNEETSPFAVLKQLRGEGKP